MEIKCGGNDSSGKSDRSVSAYDYILVLVGRPGRALEFCHDHFLA